MGISQATLSFVVGVVLCFGVVTQTANAQSILVGAPDVGDSYYGMCCNHQEAVAAEFALSGTDFVTTIDVDLVGTSAYDLYLQNSLTGSITTFATAVVNAPDSGSANTVTMTVNVWLTAGTYYLVAIQDPGSDLRVPGWFASDGTLVNNAGTVTNGVWFSNEGGLTGPWTFATGVMDGFTYNAPVFSVNGFSVGVPIQFVPVAPCRLVDTRQSESPIQGGTARSFSPPQLGGCNIPTSATAYSLNVTVVPLEPLGYLTVWPTGETQPVVSTMNSLDGRTKANAAIVPAGVDSAVSVFASNTSDLVLDIDGYFTQPNSQSYEFYPLTPCRVIDTRGANGSLGGPFLAGGTERDFHVLTSSCIPANANPQAYSFNVTVVPHTTGQQLGYLTVWPKGEPQPTVSTLNNLTATTVANAAIVPAGMNGAIAVLPSNNTDLVVDINGYFAAPGPHGLNLYTVPPCRVLDTRGAGNGNPFANQLTVGVMDSICGPPSSAQAYVFNATVIPQGPLGYLTLWPDGLGQPVVSTLNALDGVVTSNMAIVPTQNGSIDAFASNLTQLVLDISSYFAP